MHERTAPFGWWCYKLDFPGLGSAPTPMDRYTATSLIIWIAAMAEAAGGLLGLWSVSGAARQPILVVEGMLLLALLANCYGIKNWVYRNTGNTAYRKAAWLSFASLALCIAGDVVNFNLPQTFYRHGPVVKHDYLADSVLFFAPGYLLLLAAVVLVVRANGFKGSALLATLMAGAFAGGLSLASMHLPGTGLYVSAITASYAILITAVGASGLALVAAFGGFRARPAVWLVGAGLVLAAIADGIIGRFWLYGNHGEGYFPAARYVNWMLYIGSQCLVIHLARAAVWHSESRLGQGLGGLDADPV